MHSTSYNLRAKNGAWSDEKAQKEEKRSSGSDFVVLFTSAGRDAVARVHRATLISRANGDRYPFPLPPSSPDTRNLPFHFFVGKCARAVRGRAQDIV